MRQLSLQLDTKQTEQVPDLTEADYKIDDVEDETRKVGETYEIVSLYELIYTVLTQFFLVARPDGAEQHKKCEEGSPVLQ